MSPVIPHFASECLEMINLKEEINWPKLDEKIIEKHEINFVIQINGKKREVLKIKKNTKEKELLELVKKNENLNKHLKGKTLKNRIFIANKIMNLIIEND